MTWIKRPSLPSGTMIRDVMRQRGRQYREYLADGPKLITGSVMYIDGGYHIID